MLNKLDFCPYEYDESIDGFRKLGVDTPEDLAYELVFFKGYSKKNLESTSIYAGGNKADFIREGPDERREKYYQDESNYNMLWEGSPDSNEASGLIQLIRSIERGNRVLSEGHKKSDDKYETTEKEGIYYGLEWKRRDDGIYVFSYASGTRRDTIMEAWPCCPSCHQRLPVGWMDAEDFCGISLMAKSGCGKTTFLLSLMANDLKSICYLGGDWQITAAHARDDVYYKKLAAQAEDMVSRKKCPPNTSVENLIAPVFFNIDYKGHKMIAGLYDNSGEVLYEMGERDSRTKLLKYMFAHIYMIEPKQMRVKLMDKKQGVGEDPLNMYFRYKQLLALDFNKLKKQYFCITIIKCDLLEGLKEMEAIPESEYLFNREKIEDLINDDLANAREWIVEDLFDKYVFVDNKQKEILLRDFDGRVSWHCISSLGCHVTEREKNVFYLDEEYQPIRVAEPLIACLKKRVEENGWDDE